MKIKKNLVLWLRLGDGSSYEQFGDDLLALASVLVDARVPLPLRPCSGGVVADGYERGNYISLYWGSKDGEFVRNLTRGQLAVLVDYMK